jgi:hypothetical protein
MKKAIFCLNLKGRAQKLMNRVTSSPWLSAEPRTDRIRIVAIEKLTPIGGSWSAENATIAAENASRNIDDIFAYDPAVMERASKGKAIDWSSCDPFRKLGHSASN